jgi:hypothetical protein
MHKMVKVVDLKALAKAILTDETASLTMIGEANSGGFVVEGH